MTHPRWGRLRPLTEQILERLPGQHFFWIAGWALVPWANAGINLLLEGDGTSAVWDQSDLLVGLNYGALSFAVVMTLFGTKRVSQRIEMLDPTTADVLEGDERQAFREMSNRLVPLAISILAAGAFAAGAFVRDGWEAALLRGATWLVLGIAFWTFLWTYASLQLGLTRLGQRHLRRDAALVDRSLGLRPLGSLAFMGLWMLLVWLVPVLVTGLPDVFGVAMGLVVLGGVLGAFFFSLWGLHRQMVEVKTREIDAARELYAEAYEPVRTQGSLDALERQHSLLGAANALEERARAIHEWPIDERTWAWVIGIATSVVAITAGRVVVNTLGL